MSRIVAAIFLVQLFSAAGFRSYLAVPAMVPHQDVPAHVVGYDYFKKGPEKKEIGRLWKNILFPGIYVEYADTKEAKKTIKIETKTKPIKSRYEGEPVVIQKTYNAVDPSLVPNLTGEIVKEKPLKPVTKPADFVAPVPKKAKTIQLGSGISVLPNIAQFPRPKKPLILYEYEASPDCRKVREACTILDLTVEFRPCPGARSGFSDLMNTITNGRRDVPFLIDNNPNMFKPQLFGAQEIVKYLFETYGPGVAGLPKSLQGLNVANKKTGGLGGLFSGNGGKGSKTRADARPDFAKLKPITLYGWEGADFVRPVRETLGELGLAHVFINCANGSQNRNSLQKKTGTFQVPYIIDPNTGVEMFESAEIVRYLEKVYTI